MMQLLTWTMVGLLSGWLARTMLRTTRHGGLVGALITGWQGGVVGGWLFRSAGITAGGGIAGHVVVALPGRTAAGDAGPHPDAPEHTERARQPVMRCQAAEPDV